MAGQHLLHQRRARTRHADDEDRRPRWIAISRAGWKSLRRKLRLDVLEHRQMLELIVDERPPLQGIRILQMPERLIILLEIGQRLAHGKMCGNLLLLVERVDDGNQPPQSRKAAVARLEALDARETEVNGRLIRGQFESLLESIPRLR